VRAGITSQIWEEGDGHDQRSTRHLHQRRDQQDGVEAAKAVWYEHLRSRQRTSPCRLADLLLAPECRERQSFLDLLQDREFRTVELRIGEEQRGPGQADQDTGGRDRSEPYTHFEVADRGLSGGQVARRE
jgi:hypothetical protein